MQYLTLDSIVRSVLLKESKPVHYYLQYLAYGVSGLGQLNTTTLKNINSVKLPVTAYKSILLPEDYADWVQVGFAVGERIRPLIEDAKLNRLNNFDADGNKVVYPPELPDGSAIYDMGSALTTDYPYPVLDSMSNPYYDTPIFNHPLDRDDWKFKEVRERNEIQLSTSYPYAFVILDYITDGKNITDATKVDPLAQLALEKYILWQAKEHSRGSGDGERAEAERRFKEQWKLLRAAKSGLTKDQIIHAVRSGYGPLQKN